MIRNGLKVVAAVAVLGVAGCGGDSNKALSYSDFGKKADEVCKTANATIKPIGSKLTGKASTDAPTYDQLIPELQTARDNFSKLKPPSELKANYDNFLSITDQQIAKAKEAQAAAKKGDQAGYIGIIKSTQSLGQQSNLEASKLGAAECAK
jgi:hypothetical protein